MTLVHSKERLFLILFRTQKHSCQKYIYEEKLHPCSQYRKKCPGALDIVQDTDKYWPILWLFHPLVNQVILQVLDEPDFKQIRFPLPCQLENLTNINPTQHDEFFKALGQSLAQTIWYRWICSSTSWHWSHSDIPPVKTTAACTCPHQDPSSAPSSFFSPEIENKLEGTKVLMV